MKKVIILLGGTLLIIVFIFLFFFDIPLTINFQQGKCFEYKVGTFNKENNAVLDPILMKHPEIIAKYLSSATAIATNQQLHCIEPFIEISDNRSTIWSKIFPRYFLNYSLVFLTDKGDTTISYNSIKLKVRNRKLYLPCVKKNSDKDFQNIQVCDPIFIKPCMIKK
jgi:hypothetical protein